MGDCCSSALSQLTFQGEQGVGISSVSSTVVGSNTQITFTLTDGSTIGPISVPNGANGTNGTNGSNAGTKCYLLDSFIGNPYETLANGFNNKITTKSTLPMATLDAVGDSVDIDIIFSSPSLGGSPISYLIDLQFASNTIFPPTLVNGAKVYIKGTISRVTTTSIYVDIHLLGTPQLVVPVNGNKHYSAFITVPNIDSNASDIEVTLANSTGQDVYLQKFQTKITLH